VSYQTALSLALALQKEGVLVGDDAKLPERARLGLARCNGVGGRPPA
jgi:hypothetical protein